MLTDKHLLTQLEAIRDKAMDGNCDYSECQSRALEKVMDAIDILSTTRRLPDLAGHSISASIS